MPVLQCGGCPRLISVSNIPGGNPIAKAHPDQWSASYLRCPGCGAALCDRCAPPGARACKICGAALGSSAASATPGAAAATRRLPSHRTREKAEALAWGRHWSLLAILLQVAFPFVAMMSPHRWPVTVSFWAGVLLGMFAAWKTASAVGTAVWLRVLATAAQLLPLVSILVLLRLRGAALAAFESIDAGEEDEEEDEPRPRASAQPATPASAAQPAHAQRPADIDALAQRIAQPMDKPVRPYSTYDFGREQDTQARSLLVDKNFSLELLVRLRKMLPPGMVLFLGTDRWLGDENHGEQQELVLARGQDLADMVRVARVDPVNHGLDPEQVAAKLREYERQHGLTVFNASTDTVDMQFIRLPADPVPLARDLMDFCPDLCDAYATPEEFAQSLRQQRGGVTLWWD